VEYLVVSDVVKYKNKIMNKLCSIPDIVTLINNPEITQNNPDQMKNVNIFPYMKIPNITLSVKNYICFAFDARSSNYNDLYKNVNITISAICHESDIKTAWGNRYDVLGGVILESFNWSNFLGLELELYSDTESILEKEYHMRTLQFKNLTLNSLKNGVKVNGNR
jgi:hypothetical protein